MGLLQTPNLQTCEPIPVTVPPARALSVTAGPWRDTRAPSILGCPKGWRPPQAPGTVKDLQWFSLATGSAPFPHRNRTKGSPMAVGPAGPTAPPPPSREAAKAALKRFPFPLRPLLCLIPAAGGGARGHKSEGCRQAVSLPEGVGRCSRLARRPEPRRRGWLLHRRRGRVGFPQQGWADKGLRAPRSGRERGEAGPGECPPAGLEPAGGSEVVSSFFLFLPLGACGWVRGGLFIFSVREACGASAMPVFRLTWFT